MGNLLLRSLTVYSDLIGKLAAAAPNPDIVEIGSEDGDMSVFLADTARQRGGHLYVVEPKPSALLLELARRQDNVHVIEGLSPDVLVEVPNAGLFLVDGDHNYGVVRGELTSIFGRPDSTDTIVVMHDVGWPWGRRDMYYDPGSLPADAVRPHSFQRGVVLDNQNLAPKGQGFRSGGAYALALEEGGPRNGVMTALEDVASEHRGLQILTTPLVFGLAVVGHDSSKAWDDVVAAMRPYTDNPTLAQVELNRLTLFLKVLELQDAPRFGAVKGIRRLAGRAVRRATRSR